MSSQLALAQHRLFDRDVLAAANIKVFPGSARETSPEQLARQINRALSQIEAGDYERVDL